MDLDTVVVALGWVLAVVATVTAAPQAVKIIRFKDTTGVSVGTCAAGLATMVAWTYYTVGLRDWPAVGSSIGALAAWATTLIGLIILRRDPRAVLAGLGAVLFALAISLAGFSGLTAVVGSCLWALPQLRVVFQGGALHGVSAVAYAVLAAENVGWIFYSWGTGHWAYAFGPLIQGPACALICWRTIRSYRIHPKRNSTG